MPSSCMSMPPAARDRRLRSAGNGRSTSSAGTCAVGNVDAVARDVDVVEKVLEHPAVVALQPIGLRGRRYSSRLNVTTFDKSSPSSRCMRINSRYMPTGVLPVGSPSTACWPWACALANDRGDDRRPARGPRSDATRRRSKGFQYPASGRQVGELMA